MNCSHYEEKKTYRIYAMILQAEENYVYIGKTSGQRLSAVYSRHRTGGIKATAGYFDEEESPAMYLLNELNVSTSEAYKYVVAWCAVFRKAGYAGINHEGTLFQADNLLPESSAIVETLRREDLNQILQRTFLPNPAETDRTAEKKLSPEVEKKEIEKTVQMNIRISKHDKELFSLFCKDVGMNQREGFGTLLDRIKGSQSFPRVRLMLKERDAKIMALKQENQKLKAKLEPWMSQGKSQRELDLEKKLRFLNDGLQKYLRVIFPDTEGRSTLPETSYCKYTRGLPWEEKPQYPSEEGFLVLFPEAFLWGNPLHRACFLVGTGEDGKRYKLRWYPKSSYAGLFPRESSYAFPGSGWYVGCQKSKDGAMELMAAFPLQWGEDSMEEKVGGDISEGMVRKQPLDDAIKKAAEKGHSQFAYSAR